MAKIIELPGRERRDLKEAALNRHPIANLAIQILNYTVWHERGEIDSDTALYLIQEAAVTIISHWEGANAPLADNLLKEAMALLNSKKPAAEKRKLKMRINDYLKSPRHFD